MEDDHVYASSPSKKQKTTDVVDEKPAHVVEEGPPAHISPSSTVAVPPSSPAEVELRQRLRQAQAKIESANRETRAAQERAEFTKNYYDSRTRKIERDFIARDKRREKEWSEKLANATSQLDASNSRNEKLENGIGQLKKKLSREEKLRKVGETRAADDQRNYEQIIADLTTQITRLEVRLEQEKSDLEPWHRRKLQQQPVAAAKLLQPQQPTADADATNSPSQQQPSKLSASDKCEPMGRRGISKKTFVMKNEADRIICGEPNLKLHDFCDPINIFRLVNPSTPDSMTVESAVTALKGASKRFAQEKWRRYRDINRMELYCDACRVVVMKVDVFEHFLSAKHIQLVRDACGVISRPALQYWLRQLQLATSAAAVVAVPTATPPAALAAAAAAVDELQRTAAAAAEPLPLFEKEVKNEVKEEVKEEDMEMETWK